MFSTHFFFKTSYRTYIFFSKIVERQNSPFGRARKAYILKFRHIEPTIGGDIHTKVLGQCT